VQFFNLTISYKSVSLLLLNIKFTKLGILSPNETLKLLKHIPILDILLLDKIKDLTFFKIEKFSNLVISL